MSYGEVLLDTLSFFWAPAFVILLGVILTGTFIGAGISVSEESPGWAAVLAIVGVLIILLTIAMGNWLDTNDLSFRYWGQYA